jgi:hypothetical protein
VPERSVFHHEKHRDEVNQGFILSFTEMTSWYARNRITWLPSQGSSFAAMKQPNLLLRGYPYGTPASARRRSGTSSLTRSGSGRLALELAAGPEVKPRLVELQHELPPFALVLA